MNSVYSLVPPLPYSSTVAGREIDLVPYLGVGVGVIFAFRVQSLLLPPLKSYSLGLLFGLLSAVDEPVCGLA